MLDTVAPHMVQEADKENRVSNSLVCVRPLSRGPAGRKQRPGNSSAIKEEKVSSDYLHTDPVDARSCVYGHAQTNTHQRKALVLTLYNILSASLSRYLCCID